MDEKSRIGFFTIATNQYVLMLEEQLAAISEQIKQLGWKYVVATDQAEHLSKFLRGAKLTNYVRVLQCPPYVFPLASMLRFKYIKNEMNEFTHICYLDCDMRIENPLALDRAIKSAHSVNLVRHPGWDRDYGLKVRVKERMAELLVKIEKGALGSWENRKKSTAWVPRSKRARYFAGGIFFGPAVLVKQMSESCDTWMDSDFKSGIVAAFHDESYLNRWATVNDFAEQGPEFCFTEYPWLPKFRVIVRALDKSAMRLALDEISTSSE
jgi:hypothetical protein